MRCGRAQQWMTAAVDGELAPRRQRALERHVAGCAACRSELSATDQLLSSLEALPMEAAVPPALEQATLRRVRIAAAEAEAVTTRGWWESWRTPALALASMATLALAVGLLRGAGEGPGMRSAAKPAAERVARAPVAPESAPPSRQARGRAALPEPPREPPPELAAAPELYMDLPILRNLEKLQNFEAIRTTTIEDPADGQGERSNG